MSPIFRKRYFESIQKRYSRASSKKKSRILDEFCVNCNYNRKYATRKLNTPPLRNPRSRIRQKPGPKSQYNHPQILKPLEKIWQEANLPCSKRLKALVPLWLPYYELEFGKLPPGIASLLLQISSSTLDRILKDARRRFRGKGRSTTKPGLLLKTQIPIKTDQWDEKKPGFLEMDTVAHCGSSLEGHFAYTLDGVDLATGWTEQRAVWGKNHQGIVQQIKDIESSLPFPLLGFDSDNGSEFLNLPLLRYFAHRQKPVQFTRSRAYHKDDNAHIEQKNWTHIRQWLGYRRFEDPSIVDLLNDLYKNQWRYFHNFFLPSVKLLEKKRIGSKIFKIHDSPKTPYQRILQSPYIPEKTKQQLTQQYESLNPFQLRKTINQKIAVIHRLAG